MVWGKLEGGSERGGGHVSEMGDTCVAADIFGGKYLGSNFLSTYFFHVFVLTRKIF